MPLLYATLALTCVVAFPGDGSSEDSKSNAEQRLHFAKQSAAAYQFRPAGAEHVRVKLHAEPLLRWNNQVVREDDGMLFLWTDGASGRPVAAAQFFLISSDWHHEFQSLSQSSFDVRCGGERSRNWSWHPNRPGVIFAMADDGERPAESPNQRLRQMKAIAERFTAAVDSTADGTLANPEQLRLLSRPLNRYSAKDQAILDGAIFAFVQGTNPEILLLIEAHETKAGARWRYGFARMSCFQLRVERDGETVYVGERETVPSPDLNSPYHFRWSAEPDRSAELDISAAANQKE